MKHLFCAHLGRRVLRETTWALARALVLSSTLLVPLAALAQFGLGPARVGDDPDFIAKVQQRAFTSLEQTPEGKAQAYVVGTLAFLCLSAAGEKHSIFASLGSDQVLSWAGNHLWPEPASDAVNRGKNLQVAGMSSPTSMKYMPYFGAEGSCRSEPKKSIARNLLDYIEEASLGAPARESSLPSLVSAGLLESKLVAPTDKIPGRLYGVRAYPAQEEIWNQMKSLSAAGQKMLRCTYGPRATSLGAPQTFYFWHEKVPRSRRSFLEVDANNPLGAAGNRATSECPPNAHAARQFQASAWGASFAESPGTVMELTCRPFEEAGTAPDYSPLAKLGAARGTVVTFKLDVLSKIVSGVSGGAPFELKEWEHVNESETSVLFQAERPVRYQNQALSVRHTIVYSKAGPFITEDVVLQSPNYIPLELARLSWRRLLCK